MITENDSEVKRIEREEIKRFSLEEITDVRCDSMNDEEYNLFKTLTRAPS